MLLSVCRLPKCDAVCDDREIQESTAEDWKICFVEKCLVLEIMRFSLYKVGGFRSEDYSATEGLK